MAAWYSPDGNSWYSYDGTWTTTTCSTSSTTNGDWLWSQTGTTSASTNTIYTPTTAGWNYQTTTPLFTPFITPQAETIFTPHIYVPSKHNSRRNRKLSREEREAAALAERQMQERLREQEATRRELEQRQAAVRERAESLLIMHLTDEQRAELKAHKSFIVRGGNSGREYRINAANGNVSGNVHVLDAKRKVEHRLCAHCDHGIPFHDQILAQKVMLESCEQEFLRIANRQAA